MPNKISNFVKDPTYDGLVDLLTIYTNRFDSDTIDAVPFFINCAEKVILRNLRMPKMQKLAKFDMYNNGEEGGFVYVPKDFLEMETIWVEEPTPRVLQRVSWANFLLIKAGMNPFEGKSVCDITSKDGQTTPTYWAINGTRLHVYPEPTFKTEIVDGKEVLVEAQEVFLNYYQDLPELSPENNDGRSILLDLAPDAFAYLALAEAYRFLMENEKGDQFEQFGMTRLAQIKEMTARAEHENGRVMRKR